MVHRCAECEVESCSAHRQKQVDEAISRGLRGRPPSGKCAAFIDDHLVMFYHYHHLVLVYNRTLQTSLFRWHERPTDLRILLAAEAALKGV